MAWYVASSLGHSGAPGAPSPKVGNVVNESVPASIASLPLQTQDGHRVTLRQLKGHVILLAPFLTSCQEECPITTAALLVVQRALRNDGLSNKVDVVEATVDPGRDTPARMEAYAKLTDRPGPC